MSFNAHVADAMARKTEQLPQFDYLWRVELPDIGGIGALDPEGIAALNTSSAAKKVTGTSEPSIIQQIQEKANGFLTAKRDADSGTQRSNKAVRGLMLANSSGSVLSHRVYSIDFPYQNFETDKFNYGSASIHYATRNDVGSLSFVIDEYEDGDSLRYLEAWRALIANPDGTYNPPAAYKRDIKLIKMANSGIDLHVSVYKGCFPAEIGTSGFSYDSGSITQYNVTLSGDKVEHYLIPATDVLKAVLAEQEGIMEGNGYGEGDFFSLSMSNIAKAGLPAAINRGLDSKTLGKLADKVKNFFF